MESGDRDPTFTPARIAGLYLVVGSLWILFSDQLVHAAIADPTLETYAQTLKGWLFVAASAALLYVAIGRSHRELERTTERLDLALQQTSILHRILRHNLRNALNIIYGNAQFLEDRMAATAGEGPEAGEDAIGLVAEERDPVEAIESEIDSLLEIAEKTRLLRNVVLFDAPTTEPVDVATTVEERLDGLRERHPDATIRAELPPEATAETHPDLGVAIEELVENAIVHHHESAPTVEISVESAGEAEPSPADDRRGESADAVASDGGVRVEIEDDGPGVPDMELAVLDAGVERQTFHSVGLGLWLAQTLVTETGGDLEIASNDDDGTVVQIELPEPRDG